MPQILRTRKSAGAAGALVLAVGALATYVAAQPTPPQRNQQPTRIRTLRQPIGQPRIKLEVTPRLPKLAPEVQMPGVCAAPLDVTIRVREIGMNMRTEQPAVWYSLVDTIPPVGHTASITVDPVNLLEIEGDRKVGTLVSGEVKFREVVSDIPLDGSEAENRSKLRTLLRDFGNMTPERLRKLSALPVTPYVLPGPGVQVMRAELEETYEIDGYGRDTVALSGWIAVTHDAPRPAAGETEVTWSTAVLDTEFVGLDLHGVSRVFGPIHIQLDTTRPARGQVGRIELPDLARYALIAKFKKHDVAENRPPASALIAPQPWPR